MPSRVLGRIESAVQRPALITMWSKDLPLTASCLSPLSGFESHSGYVKKLPVLYCVFIDCANNTQNQTGFFQDNLNQI